VSLFEAEAKVHDTAGVFDGGVCAAEAPVGDAEGLAQNIYFSVVDVVLVTVRPVVDCCVEYVLVKFERFACVVEVELDEGAFYHGYASDGV
jgi:hypothetical protein